MTDLLIVRHWSRIRFMPRPPPDRMIPLPGAAEGMPPCRACADARSAMAMAAARAAVASRGSLRFARRAGTRERRVGARRARCRVSQYMQFTALLLVLWYHYQAEPRGRDAPSLGRRARRVAATWCVPLLQYWYWYHRRMSVVLRFPLY